MVGVSLRWGALARPGVGLGVFAARGEGGWGRTPGTLRGRGSGRGSGWSSVTGPVRPPRGARRARGAGVGGGREPGWEGVIGRCASACPWRRSERPFR